MAVKHGFSTTNKKDMKIQGEKKYAWLHQERHSARDRELEDTRQGKITMEELMVSHFGANRHSLGFSLLFVVRHLSFIVIIHNTPLSLVLGSWSKASR